MATARERAAIDAHITREQWDNEDGPRPLFDITCVIGTIFDDPSSPLNPHQAAFVAIADHDAPGKFSFPGSGGHVYTVTVERQDPPQDASTDY